MKLGLFEKMKQRGMVLSGEGIVKGGVGECLCYTRVSFLWI